MTTLPQSYRAGGPRSACAGCNPARVVLGPPGCVARGDAKRDLDAGSRRRAGADLERRAQPSGALPHDLDTEAVLAPGLDTAAVVLDPQKCGGRIDLARHPEVFRLGVLPGVGDRFLRDTQ